MKPLVSVIIPVYNAGESLHACVQSLLNQTLKNIELIFVLDCPTDGSDQIIEDYANKYTRIIVIKNPENLNIGVSRNIGLQYANGEYVAFCDHDDIVEPYMYEEMYNIAHQKNADLVLGVPQYCYSDSSLNETYYYPDTNNIKNRLLSLLIGRDKHDSSEWIFYFSHGVIWDNIYRKNVIENNNIQFVDNNKCTFEDNLFLINFLINSNNVEVYNKHCYNHIITGYNTSSNANYTRYPLVLEYINVLYRLLCKHNMQAVFCERFSNTVVMYITGAFVCEIKKYKFRIWKTMESYYIMRQTPIIRRSFLNCTRKPYSHNYLKKIFLYFINFLFRI